MSQAGNIAGPEGLADGPGIWVNMWNYPQGSTDLYCENLHAKGVRNLFIQTSRSNTEAITHPEELGQIIESAHRYKIRVIAWSFAELFNPIADADKLVAAARFTTPHGQRLDAVAANLEKDLSPAKVEPYSQHLREALGPTYPTVAVVYSPLNHAPQVAHIPWKLLDKYYTVLAPMNYWNSKYQKLDAYTYTIATIQAVREKVGRPDVEIHVIGDGMGTHGDSISQFMRACQQAGATSASIYPNYKVTDEQLDTIAKYSEFFPVNSRFRLAALHETLASGSMDSPQGMDPAASISRGDFYKLAVKQLGLARQFHLDRSSVTAEQATELLQNTGALAMAKVHIANDTSMDETLRAPIDAKEALNVVASVITIRSNPGAKLNAGRHKGWFGQPAYAAEHDSAPSKPVNYLDAAQIVVQASAGVTR
ncbi:MAG TPA: hypothetical protein V6C81_15100 [Planktothrix sp.]|jgi:hypothetical protein